VAVVAGISLAPTAFAHVTVNPGTAAPGSFTKLTFRVPNEMSDANTTKLEVQLPTDSPFASVSIQPVDGWTYSETKTKLASPIKSDDGDVSEAVQIITWSGGVVKPGEFQEFSLSVGPLPTDKAQLVFKVLQTYDNGETVSWIQESAPGGEAEHPAPVLKLVAAADASTPRSDGDDGEPLGIVGIVVGAAGLIVGAIAMVTARRRSAT
jgi:uncharacterized protein YcnI